MVRVEYSTPAGRGQREFALAGLADNQAFLETLRHESIETIHTQETTLEDVFIRVTGQQLT
jgi:fluoroquinolone transport system ATP-binding protein